MFRSTIDNDSDNDSDSPNPSESETESESDDSTRPENHPIMTKMTSNWKFVGIISAFMNRCILEKVNLNKSFTLNKDKKVITNLTTGDPVILNVTSVDVYSLNLYRQMHQSLNSDLRYFRSRHESKDEAPESVVHVYPEDLSDDLQDVLDKLLIGLITLNEHIFNFLSNDCENLYDFKIKKMIEHFVRQKDYYLSIGQVKIKCDREDQELEREKQKQEQEKQKCL
jgi:hypothetical protein